MPELPEVETIVRGLSARLINKRISSVRVLDERMLRSSGKQFSRALTGRTIVGLRRHGKSIFIDLDQKPLLYIHLGMTGQLLFSKPGDRIDPHTHVIISFEDADIELRYRDIRRFGRVKILPETKTFSAPDAWAAPVEEVFDRLREKSGMLKHVLLNQQVVAGLGNIYVDETLFRSKLHPRKTFEKVSNEKLQELCGHMRDVLKQSIDLGGTSFRNYVDTQGGRGGFRGDLLVYGKQGTPCPTCKTKIKKMVVAGRGTHFCPRCQRG